MSTSGGRGLRLATAASDLLAGELRRARVTEIGLLRAAPGVTERDAKDGAAAFLDFLTAVVADENRLSGHVYPSWRYQLCLQQQG
jgi:hypothetical protein